MVGQVKQPAESTLPWEQDNGIKKRIELLMNQLLTYTLYSAPLGQAHDPPDPEAQ